MPFALFRPLLILFCLLPGLAAAQSGGNDGAMAPMLTASAAAELAETTAAEAEAARDTVIAAQAEYDAAQSAAEAARAAAEAAQTALAALEAEAAALGLQAAQAMQMAETSAAEAAEIAAAAELARQEADAVAAELAALNMALGAAQDEAHDALTALVQGQAAMMAFELAEASVVSVASETPMGEVAAEEMAAAEVSEGEMASEGASEGALVGYEMAGAPAEMPMGEVEQPDIDLVALEAVAIEAAGVAAVLAYEQSVVETTSAEISAEANALGEQAESTNLGAETAQGQAEAAGRAVLAALAAVEAATAESALAVADAAQADLRLANAETTLTDATQAVEEAIMQAAEAAALADTTAAIEAALAQCHALAGPPDAGVAVTEEVQEAQFVALEEAEPFCVQALELGSEDPLALFTMGAFHQLYGDHDEAMERFQQAADAGIPEAHTRLGDYHLFGIGPLRRDADQAVSYFRAGAEGEDPAAIMTLGLLHRIGMGVPRDTVQMINLMRQAADQGYHFAQFRLGQIYLTGEGIPGGGDASLGIPDREAAARYLSLAAEQGNIEAVLELGVLHSEAGGAGTGDADAQFRWTQAAVEAGFPDAIAALGFLYERGRGVEPDPQRAAELYIEALETGDVDFDDLRGQVGGRIPDWNRDTARAFQVILQERGLYDGAIDGIIGRGSRAGAAALGG